MINTQKIICDKVLFFFLKTQSKQRYLLVKTVLTDRISVIEGIIGIFVAFALTVAVRWAAA
ncbi:MAG TPA: hypothetical protein DDZ96_13700 [Porphyromonadaceae bacterium]|nr:hypothetical protein [Porphyromonadaceae bacterium]HBK33275.1 hypothetical protein [Porphyromonadaceae bacterium]HBL34848.1 hypothetical protein [Porphyromonadaceae bacterium]HBX21739.1 hypothetical protein [Porphyromonadaceae bacterium]HCM22460.1 hypothetical protein [Porphyromonadaceae bacterium]